MPSAVAYWGARSNASARFHEAALDIWLIVLPESYIRKNTVDNIKAPHEPPELINRLDFYSEVAKQLKSALLSKKLESAAFPSATLESLRGVHESSTGNRGPNSQFTDVQIRGGPETQGGHM
jgi:hypothetical protein